MAMRWVVLALLGGLLLAGPPVLAGPQDAAESLFVEAVKLSEKAETERDSLRRRDLLREAFAKLERIVDEHPDSEVAIRLISGEVFDQFDPAVLRERLRDAEQAAAARQVASNAARTAPPPVAVKLSTKPADPATPEGKILTAVVGALENLLSGLVEAPGLEFSQPITAEREGDRILLRFLGTKLKDAGSTAELGNFLLSVLPRANGRYGFTLGVPTLIRVLDEQGKEAAQLTFNEPRARGIYWPELGTFEQLELVLSGLKMVTLEGGQRKTVSELAGLSLEQTYAEEPGKKLSGRSGLSLAGLKVIQSDGQVLEIGKLGLGARMTDVDLPAALRLNEQLGGGMFGSPNSRPDGTPQRELTAEQIRALTDFIEAVGFGHLSGEITLSGLKGLEKGKPQFALDEGAVRVSFDTTKALGSVGFGLELGKFTATDKLPLPAGLTPSRLNIDLVLDRVPIRQLFVLALSAGQAAGSGGDPAELIDPGELMNMATNAMPELRLDRLTVATPLLELVMKGSAAYDAQAPGLLNGGLDGTIRGLDRAVKALNELAKKDPEAKQMLSMLVLLKGVGRPEVQAGGEAVYSYRIEMSPDGPTINGTPIDQLMK